MSFYGYPGGPVDIDFRKVYGLDFFTFKNENSLRRTAGYVGALGPHSETVAEELGGYDLDFQDMMLLSIELQTRSLFWEKTQDAHPKAGSPKHVPEPAMPEHLKKFQQKDTTELQEFDSSEDFIKAFVKATRGELS